MGTTERLTASLEDYLEAIFHLVAEKQVARAKGYRQADLRLGNVVRVLRGRSGTDLPCKSAQELACSVAERIGHARELAVDWPREPVMALDGYRKGGT